MWVLLGTVASVLVATAGPAGALACDFTLGEAVPLTTPGVVKPGGVFSWGRNNLGQLADGTQVNELVPGAAADPGPGAGVIKVVGTSHILALMADGSVWSWGKNDLGQLGRGNNVNSAVPAPVNGLGPGSNVVDIAAGFNHSLALKADGTVLAWGANSNGQLGDGTQIDRNAPVQNATLGSGSGVIALGAGVGHSVALKTGGTVWAWAATATVSSGTTTRASTRARRSRSRGSPPPVPRSPSHLC